MSPRVFRLVALPAPTEREKTQLYGQRYLRHLPAGGEIVIFDGSWYNRAGVEHVVGFCTEEQYKNFLKNCPAFENFIVNSGIILLKYWLDVSEKEQPKRFLACIEDPSKRWKLSPMNLASHRRWYDYSRARDAMRNATDTPGAPWYVVPSDDKKRARLNCIADILSRIPYEETRTRRPSCLHVRKQEGIRSPHRDISSSRSVGEARNLYKERPCPLPARRRSPHCPTTKSPNKSD